MTQGDGIDGTSQILGGLAGEWVDLATTRIARAWENQAMPRATKQGL